MKKMIAWMLLLTLTLGSLLGMMPVSAAGASDQPKAPVSVEYQLDEVGSGMAAGVVTVTLPAGHGAEDIRLFWGDDNGKLAGYTALAPFKVSGNVVRHRIPAGTVIPQGATRLLAYSSADALGTSSACASVALPANAALTDAQLGTLLFEFQSVGDIHLTTTVSSRLHHSDHMRAMMKDIMKNSPNTIGIFNNGDTVNNGKDEDYEEFLRIYSSIEGAPIVYSGFGNHELFRYGTDSKFPKGEEEFSVMKTAYWDFLGESIPADASFVGDERYSSLSFSFVRNDCKFIFLGTDVLHQNNLGLDAETLAWLEDELEAARGKGNPIFIIMHQPMTGTIAGTFKNNYGVIANTDAALKALLAKYPEVIMFNGHTHRDFDQYATHYMRDDKLPNMFGSSSVGYLARTYDSTATETYKGSQGYYVYVYEDKVLIRGRNFLDGEWVSAAQFLVDLSEEGLEKDPQEVVAPPLYGSTANLYADGNSLSGTVTCNMPANHNADAIALFFASADTGIIGSDPFATYEVNNDSYFTCNIDFADVAMPYTADYLLVYAYSSTLGWSADCDIIDLGAQVKGGGAPTSGRVTLNKYSFMEGEPILVTAHENAGTSWIGIRNVASSDYRTWNYWRIADVGIGTAVDLSKDHFAFKRDFTALTPGVYEIAWLEVTGGGFLESKTPENTTTFVVHANGYSSTSGAVQTNKQYYRLGEPILVTATKGTEEDWIGMQLTSVNSGTRIWYNLGVSGLDRAFDITKKSSYADADSSQYKFEKLVAGVYQIAWMSAAKSNFQTGKEAKNTLQITVVDMSEMLALGVPVGDGVTDPNASVLNQALLEASKLNQDHYTAESWQVLQAAVDAATQVKDKSDHTQEELDEAYEGILAALSGLVKVAVKPAPEPDQRPDENVGTGENNNDASAETDAITSEEETDSSFDLKAIFGCNSAVAATPFCILLALIPVVFKKKKSE